MNATVIGQQVLVDDNDRVWRTWTDGFAVGFQVTDPSGRVEYVYLNPSDGAVGVDDPESTAFIYAGSTGDPSIDEPQCFIDLFIEPSA